MIHRIEVSCHISNGSEVKKQFMSSLLVACNHFPTVKRSYISISKQGRHSGTETWLCVFKLGLCPA